MINFAWSADMTDKTEFKQRNKPDEQALKLNAYLLIAPSGDITAMVPNPEFGQNVMTSMPMVLAEEMDADWQRVIAKQANYDARAYDRQFTGGSQSIHQAWNSLRVAGASARQMLVAAAAQQWQVPASEISTEQSVLRHHSSGKQSSYGAMASAAAKLSTPEEVSLKDKADFKLIGNSKKNTVGEDIVTGKPLFGLDYKTEGTLVAMIVHPPAFGQELASANLAAIKKMDGIVDAFSFETVKPDYQNNYFDSNAFPKLVAIVGLKTWQVLKAKRALTAEWSLRPAINETIRLFGTETPRFYPQGLESSTSHTQQMQAVLNGGDMEVLRADGDINAAFDTADTVLERTYTAPYLAHNTMEPMNFYASVKGTSVHVAGPLQAPVFIQGTLAARLNIPQDNIEIEFTRMGGGFGRRAYSHYLVEAAAISQAVKAPVKLMYTREDDMTGGIYRPTYSVKIKGALKNNKLVAYRVSGTGIPEHCIAADRFPAGAVDNYLAEAKAIDSNITTGAFRAPRSNFMASAEQSFLDEIAELAGADAIDFRLELLKRAKDNPVGEKNDYDPERYAGVLKLARESSGWDKLPKSVNKGVAAYFCHNSYAAQVIIVDDNLAVDKVFSAMDCGIVVNRDAAINMVEGAVIDGVGNALFGEMTFTDGVPDKSNFDRYRMIRMKEAPKEIHVSFVENLVDPTGLGEPPFPPVFPALANALYKATGTRLYEQPYAKQLKPSN
ncbi:xanthine dehydrogenase family protein molybdopterin-binding subunit [Halioxenophilus aromaticivorans]|uniref:Xanthine dehydrogenase family protein molybdopterin-binding subunit n=2 Tax=Halioxenophilus aromaticivorans TaxID=1306992 RepID=A0AAV3U7P2_9ALTE